MEASLGTVRLGGSSDSKGPRREKCLLEASAGGGTCGGITGIQGLEVLPRERKSQL